MAEVQIKDPTMEASFRQKQAIGLALVDAAFPEGLNKGEASAWISRLKSTIQEKRQEALSELIEQIR